jgi:hypothetical protein
MIDLMTVSLPDDVQALPGAPVHVVAATSAEGRTGPSDRKPADRCADSDRARSLASDPGERLLS